jgi:Putative ABC exporter
VDRSLWLLLGLQARGRVRRLARLLASVRGGLLVLFGAGVFVLMLWPSLTGDLPAGRRVDDVRRLGPLFLAAMCLYFLVFATGERALTFTPAEVNWLFPAPYHRRQLLLYKIAGMGGGLLITAAIITVVARAYYTNYIAAFGGLVLTAFFLQLVSMLIALITCALGEHAFTRRRQITLGLVALVLVIAVLQVGIEPVPGGWEQLAERVEQSPVLHAILTPLRWFVDALTADRLSDFALPAALCLALDILLVLAVLALDAHYLETAAAASERAYTRLEKIRQTGSVALGAAGRARFALPPLPSWGGIGPLAWRQLTTALRSPRALIGVVLVFGIATMPFALSGGDPEAPGSSAGAAAGMLIVLSVAVPQMIPFDFRSDMDRMEVLKTLPVKPWRIVVGQLLTPVLLLTFLQWLALAGVQIWWQRFDPLLIALAAFAPLLNGFLVGLENLLFLWYPARQLPTTPGDLHQFGRQMLLLVAKTLGLMVAVLPAALLGWSVLLVGGGLPLASAIAWVVLLGPLIGLIPLLALAFERFDVSRDVAP